MGIKVCSQTIECELVKETESMLIVLDSKGTERRFRKADVKEED